MGDREVKQTQKYYTNREKPKWQRNDSAAKGKDQNAFLTYLCDRLSDSNGEFKIYNPMEAEMKKQCKKNSKRSEEFARKKLEEERRIRKLEEQRNMLSQMDAAWKKRTGI